MPCAIFIVLFSVISCMLLYVWVGNTSGEGTEKNEQEINIEEIAKQRRQMSDNIFINGSDYSLAYPVKTYLIMGTDGDGNISGIGAAYRGDCADSLALVVVDDEAKSYGTVQIDRDTMMDIDVLDDTGEFAYTSFMQLCLAHVYGRDPAAGCRNVKKAVSELFGEIDINRYYALPISSVQRINNLLGQVPVTIEDDFSGVTDAFVMGETITLSDEQAELFVRSRMNVGEGDNVSRMRRQKTYVDSARKRFQELAGTQRNFALDFFSQLSDLATTDMSLEELRSLTNKLTTYTSKGEFAPDGWFEENDTFNDGTLHKEFYADEASIEEIIQALYPVEKEEFQTIRKYE